MKKIFLALKVQRSTREKRHEAVHKLSRTCQLGIDLGLLVLENCLLLIRVLRGSDEYSLDVLVKDDIFTDL